MSKSINVNVVSKNLSVGHIRLLFNTNMLYVAFIYFFINKLFLPSGYLYTILLTPFFIIWLQKEKVFLFKPLCIYFCTIIAYYAVQSLYGVSTKDYVISTCLYLTCLIFAITAYTFLKKYWYSYDYILEQITYYNIALVIIAFISLLVWKQNNIFWFKNENGISRLKMFTSESSDYSLRLVPIFFYYFQYFFYSNLTKKRKVLFASIVASLLFSLSFGTIGGILASLIIFVFINLVTTQRSLYNRKLTGSLIFLIVLLVVLILGPLSNSLFVGRIFNIINGNDTSVNGRSFEAYDIANRALSFKNHFFGMGPGQFKIYGKKLLDDYYQYDLGDNDMGSARIPSAVAETLVVFGYIGVAIRFIAEFVLFYKTKVYKSSYRFCLFLYMFINQFVGSNTVNIYEYVIWIISFSNVFPDSYFKKIKWQIILPYGY